MTPDLNKIYTGDCIEVMKTWPENWVDTIITDPPYGIGFMGKAWDAFDIDKTIREKRRRTPRKDGRGFMSTENKAFCAGEYDRSVEANRNFQGWCCSWATEALRIAKPGAIMLVSGGTRTFHRMTAGLEDTGWQIRDCLMWLYGSGFPKSLDISKAIDKAAKAEREVVGYKRQGPRSMFDGGKPRPATLPATLWNGWGTALKPAWEPIIVAMKPLDGTFAANAEKWGVAGLNVDGGRIGTHDYTAQEWAKKGEARTTGNAYGEHKGSATALPKGRWPSNLLLDEEAAGMLDGQSGGLGESKGGWSGSGVRDKGYGMKARPEIQGLGFGDSSGASRFFYVAKSCRAERNEGCDELPMKVQKMRGHGNDEKDDLTRKMGSNKPSANHHPTVKPLELMKYLCQLTRTPTGGIVLDPFCGSGSTLWAAEFHNRPWLGIEMNIEYVKIAEARIARERAQMKMAI
jgi:site-specific DNA-methyltransferase (adenine-specific)